ncbi:hypothetical protein [Sinorhizobium alkalisoli]|uniref:hypothetical protein n=1 Tax=Sinorhizobium alkalisoli TaxID=1752398 RepID=UPI0012A982CE|nr:hypothetical protein [Sinorhizobium alkalisoli]MCA1491999.1 hypothetical protein [Ensifer sp. NBAIM29]QFI67656.1 hypothetical protein EKH55_2782 [Sinorhizobium alkalisoli]
MRSLLLFIVVSGSLMTVDWIVSEGRHSRAVWREAREQTNFIRYQLEYWVGDIVGF